MKNQSKWIPVNCNYAADVMPEKDCEVWVARGGFGRGWIQKIPYYAETGHFDWDGIFAYQPVVEGETPEPYLMQYANKDIVCAEIIDNQPQRSCKNDAGKNCKTCTFPCRNSGKDLIPITSEELRKELRKRGYIICDDYEEQDS